MARIFERYEARARKILDDNWTGSFTRPSSGLYPHQWNWDSGFIAIGRSHYDTQGAISEIESLFAGQWQNGMVPQIVFDPDALGHYFPEPDFWQVERSPSAPRGIPTSGITMPPIHAVAVEAIWDNASRKREVRAFLESIFPRLMDLHDYLYRERDPGRTGLVAIRHPWESGIDNSPAWDEPLRSIRIQPDLLPPYRRLDLEHVPSGMRPSDEDYDRYVYLVDLFRRLDYDEASIRSQCPFLVLDPLFNSILSRANRSLARLAGILGLRQERIQAWERRTSEAIRTTLWCPDRSMFYPRDAHTGRFIYADTSSGFLPLYAGAATREQAEHLYRRLDSVSFCALHQGNCYTVPNYDTQKEDFDRSNYWRGPVWININWMLAHGLARYGYTLKADSLRRDLLQLPIRFGFHEYFDSFSGEGYGSRDFSWTAALFIDLVEGFYSREARRRSPWRFLRSALRSPEVLNGGRDLPSCPLETLSGELMRGIREMKDTFYDTQRGLVDYRALGRSKQYERYRILTNGLRGFDVRSLAAREERLAFWINLYNTLVVDGIVKNEVSGSVLEHPAFFTKVCYDIGGRRYSLDDIEHGVLRGNRHRPYSPFPPFAPWDPARRQALGEVDPRIHFALVCGSRSCAPIRFYSPDLIHRQLDEASVSFINSSEVLVFPEEDRLLLSEIFRWYARDFGGREGVIRFLLHYMADGQGRQYLEKRGADIALEYLFYDWDLNRWGR